MLETHASGTVLRAISSVCYGTSDMIIMEQFFRVLCPKISTGLEKLAPTGWHGWHVFATLIFICKIGLRGAFEDFNHS